MSRQPGLALFRWHKPAVFIITTLFISAALMGAAQAAGELDLTFGTEGKVFTDFLNQDDIASGVVVQADGKIIVVGTTNGFASSTYDFAVARYNSDGSLDSTFGAGGKVTTDLSGTSDSAHRVALQSDGKILVVGSTFNMQSDFAVVRYNSDGGLDSTFGTGGKVSTDFAGFGDVANAVVIQTDGKIVVGGTAATSESSNNIEYGLARYNTNGSLDTTFDTDGKVTTGIFGEDNINDLALYPDGRILAAGYSNDNFSLARYNSNGNLDTTFDTDGRVLTDFFGASYPDKINAVAIRTDGKIVAAGWTTVAINPPNSAFALARYNTDGSLDTTFDGDGKAYTVAFTSPNPCCTPGEAIGNDVALTTDGKIVVAGYASLGDFTLMRYQSNGSLDTNFGERGRLFNHLTTNFSRAYTMAIQADGKILAAGRADGFPSGDSTNFALVRYEANPKAIPIRSDFDLDGKTDVAVFRPSNGIWYFLNNTGGTAHAQPFGATGDVAMPGDYDGDGGGTDFAVFRPSNSTWYILQSSNGAFRAEAFGASGDVPVPADYDGDGKTDVAVYRPAQGTWYILHSSDSSLQAQAFGNSTDKPVPGYYDGDGKADIAVFRDSTATWYIMESTTGTLRAQVWGASGDQPVEADYDGDGKYDLAVFRPSNGYWYVQRSFDNVLMATAWGVAGDRPVPGDYNGDFRTDLAVWRPSDGNWYIYNLPSIGYQTIPFGASGDTPVPAAYLP